MASSNSRSSSQPRRVTHTSRSSAMCAGGPPNPMQPIRPHSRRITRSPGAGARAWSAPIARSDTLALIAGWLEQLDWIAGGVLEQDLLATRPADDVVAERQTGGPQPLDVGRDVLDDEVDPVPASRPGRAPVGHRPPGRARRSAQQQPQVAAHDVGERGGGAGADLEAEMCGVEG